MFVFRNLSAVYAGLDALRSAGIAGGLRPVPQAVPSRCGLVLQCSGDSAMEARAVLQDLSAPPLGEYRQVENSWEVLWLKEA